MAQSLQGVFDALFSSFVPLFAASVGSDDEPVLVCFGPPGQYEPSAIVSIGKATTEITRPTLGTNRSREMAAHVEVWFSVYTQGDESMQQVSTDCAMGLVTILESNLRADPGQRLGGVCRDAWLSKGDPEFSVAVDPATGLPTGRVTDVHAVVTCLIRY